MTHIVVRFKPASFSKDTAYAETLARAWEAGRTIINVEHDNEFSQDLVDQLLLCPEPLCTHAYRMWVPYVRWAHGFAQNRAGMMVRWIDEGETLCDWSGIGFCKITPAARLMNGEFLEPLPLVHWRSVEAAVNQRVTVPWHVHWPEIEHDHRTEREAISGTHDEH